MPRFSIAAAQWMPTRRGQCEVPLGEFRADHSAVMLTEGREDGGRSLRRCTCCLTMKIDALAEMQENTGLPVVHILFHLLFFKVGGIHMSAGNFISFML